MGNKPGSPIPGGPGGPRVINTPEGHQMDQPIDMPTQGGAPGQSQQPIDRTLSIYEIIMIAFFGLFLVNCFFGKRSNENLAFRWYRTNEPFFQENYAHIGFDREYNVNATAPI
jgi:hypothetical protein